MKKLKKSYQFFIKGTRYVFSFISPDRRHTLNHGIFSTLRILFFWNSLLSLHDKLRMKRVVRFDKKTRATFIVNNYREIDRLDRYFTKEPETIQWIQEYIRPGEILFDIGANIGQYSIFCAVTKKGTVVYSFEPSAANFARLNENISVNGLSGSVIPYNLAFSDKTNLARFQITTLKPGYAMHQLEDRDNSSYLDPSQYSHVQGIFTTSMDEAINRLGLPIPHHIKIDVDGVENLIVRGGGSLLKQPCLKTVMLEIDAPNKDYIVDAMTSYGFVCEKKKTNFLFKRA